LHSHTPVSQSKLSCPARKSKSGCLSYYSTNLPPVEHDFPKMISRPYSCNEILNNVMDVSNDGHCEFCAVYGLFLRS